jgi:fibronectin type 3 domain-containing protein
VTQNYIYRRTSSGSYPAAPTVKISAATSYVDTKLTSGNTYCYQVTAVSSGGESLKSSEVCAKAK